MLPAAVALDPAHQRDDQILAASEHEVIAEGEERRDVQQPRAADEHLVVPALPARALVDETPPVAVARQAHQYDVILVHRRDPGVVHLIARSLQTVNDHPQPDERARLHALYLVVGLGVGLLYIRADLHFATSNTNPHLGQWQIVSPSRASPCVTGSSRSSASALPGALRSCSCSAPRQGRGE